MMLNIQLLRHI